MKNLRNNELSLPFAEFSSVTTHASSTTDFGPSHSPFGSTSFTSSLLRSPKMEKVTFDEYGNYGDGEIGMDYLSIYE